MRRDIAKEVHAALKLATKTIKDLTAENEMLRKELDKAEIERDAALDRNEELEGTLFELGQGEDL